MGHPTTQPLSEKQRVARREMSLAGLAGIVKTNDGTLFGSFMNDVNGIDISNDDFPDGWGIVGIENDRDDGTLVYVEVGPL